MLVGTLGYPIGGTTVSFGHLLQYLEQQPGASVQLVNTAGIRGCGLVGYLRLFYVLCRIFAGIPRCDVVGLHLACTAVPILCPVVGWWCRVWHKPLHLRIFGGVGWRGETQAWTKYLSGLLLQTQELCQKAKMEGMRHVEWLPTSRPMERIVPEAREPSGDLHCVFVGRLTESKGVRSILRILPNLPKAVYVDFIGPVVGEVSISEIERVERATYCGEVPHDELVARLREYDLLLFPTEFMDEGYPGVILEAFIAGVPVITTRWKCIPELTGEDAAVLIPPSDDSALRLAIIDLLKRPEQRELLAEVAWQHAQGFSSAYWNEWYLRFCRKQVEKCKM